MEEIIATGQSDFVEIGRALLADPYLPKKAFEGKAEDITPCLRCYECFGETGKSETVKCSVNPTMGQQFPEKSKHKTAMYKKKVLIAGGGPAGMEAAITAAQRGHDVTLVEKSDKLGGNLYPAGAAYFKKDIIDFCNVLIKRVENAGVKVILNTEVTKEYVKEFSPDTLMVAIGSKELVPSIKGIDSPKVVMAIDAELNHNKLGEKVVIMGGGLVGSEAAVSFKHDGKECSIIEMKSDVAEDVNSFYRGGLMVEVEKSATIYRNTMIKEIVHSGVLCTRNGEEFIIEADSIVCALGFRAPYDKVDELCDLVDEYYIIGDCKNVGQIYDAVNNAYYSAMMI